MQGSILKSLISFAFPVLLALFLQAMYGAADLIIVGKFAGTYEQSGVATGSQLLNMITMVITGLTMGITVFVGNCIGAGKRDDAGKGVGCGIAIFIVIAFLVTILVVPLSDILTKAMHAPKEAFSQTSNYIKICGAGTVFITAYNVLGSVFRGIGDSKTPLLTVLIACIINIVGDLILVAGLEMGAAGAATATVLAQAVSVIFSLYFIHKKSLPFSFSMKYIRFRRLYVKKILMVGTPIALQELLVQFSFLFIQVVVNNMGVTESAAVGVAEKVCIFFNVGCFSIHAVYFCICGTKLRCGRFCPSTKSPVLWNFKGVSCRNNYRLNRLFRRILAVLHFFKRNTSSFLRT